MSQTPSSKTQDEYEDDFEKDLDWLISEEGKSEDQDPDYEDIEAEIDKELEEDEEQMKKKDEEQKEKNGQEEGEEERWPTPMEPLEGVVEPDDNDMLDEEKKYILEKIQQANRQLQNQEPPNHTRRRRLQFKDTLVDLVVPAQEYQRDGAPQRNDETEEEHESALHRDSEVDVSEKMFKLKISQRDESTAVDRAAGEESYSGAGKEGRVLVEKDGKFDLVSLKDVESHGLLPPLPSSYGDSSRRGSPVFQSKSPSASPRQLDSSSAHSIKTESLHAPKPPALPRNRPSSATHSLRSGTRLGTKRRVQSASGTPSFATYTLSPQQKEQLTKLRQRRERLAKEEEQRKHEEEEQRRQENEMAFRAWLMKKRDQLQEERRVQKAQEMERMSCMREYCDPHKAFKVWLQRKQEQQLRERQLEEMKKLEQESGFYFRNREECERAFKTWLRRKRAEKRAEQQAARERSRRLVLEERRARRVQDLLCTVNETKPFCYNDPYGFRF
ncbi:coiled-coil domain-containing protein 181 [Chanos chanos]|uniref:Coiled-coil domain-containing protein 181 n=1 Tax=Chanos chanos TaxID=29144 RepID=A0A6J2W9M3_CHACN|nr:coiled-coil domain-containing protein 181 [Chanos chanos]